MGIRVAFVFECDSRGGCDQVLTIISGRAKAARYEARMRGWTSLLDDRGDGPGQVLWACPAHAEWIHSTRSVLLLQHEDWCPRTTRGGPCLCRDHPRRDAREHTGWARGSRVRTISLKPGYL